MRCGLLWLTISFLMMLPNCGKAQEYYSLQELKQQVQNGWHKVYQACEREISVDVDVVMPDVEFIPIDKVEWARTQPALSEKEIGAEIVNRPDENIFALNSHAHNEIPDSVAWKYEAQYSFPSDKEHVYAPNSTMTLRSAIDVVKNTLEGIDFETDNWELERPYHLSVYSLWDPRKNKMVLPGEYALYFYQRMNGIPILLHAGGAYNKKTYDNYSAMLNAWLIDESKYRVYFGMLKPTERIAADVPLCSFETIIDAFEKEIYAGHIRKVFELEFGYGFFNDPEMEEMGYYYLVPVWKLNCLYLSNREKELPDYNSDDETHERDSLDYATLLVNAQTGKMLEYMSKSEDRANYDGIIKWANITKD